MSSSLYLAYSAASRAQSVTTAAGDALKDGGGDGTSSDMQRIWDKLAEHDKRFDRIEEQMRHVSTELSHAKFWYVGTTAAIVLAGLGLVYSARQDTTATIGAALSAIQTVISHKQGEAAPSQPTVIVVPAPAPLQAVQPTQAPQTPQAPKP